MLNTVGEYNYGYNKTFILKELTLVHNANVYTNIYGKIMMAISTKGHYGCLNREKFMPTLHREIYINRKMALELGLKEWVRFLLTEKKNNHTKIENKNSRQMG